MKSLSLILAPIPIGLLLWNDDIGGQAFGSLRPAEPGFFSLLGLIAFMFACCAFGGFQLCGGGGKGRPAVAGGIVLGLVFTVIDATVVVFAACGAGLNRYVGG